MNYCAVFSDHEVWAVDHPHIWKKHAVIRHDFALGEIAQNREGDIQLLGKLFLRRSVIAAYAEDFGAATLELSLIGLIGEHFLGAAAGECGREECQYHGCFATET